MVTVRLPLASAETRGASESIGDFFGHCDMLIEYVESRDGGNNLPGVGGVVAIFHVRTDEVVVGVVVELRDEGKGGEGKRFGVRRAIAGRGGAENAHRLVESIENRAGFGAAWIDRTGQRTS